LKKKSSNNSTPRSFISSSSSSNSSNENINFSINEKFSFSNYTPRENVFKNTFNNFKINLEKTNSTSNTPRSNYSSNSSRSNVSGTPRYFSNNSNISPRSFISNSTNSNSSQNDFQFSKDNKFEFVNYNQESPRKRNFDETNSKIDEKNKKNS